MDFHITKLSLGISLGSNMALDFKFHLEMLSDKLKVISPRSQLRIPSLKSSLSWQYNRLIK